MHQGLTGLIRQAFSYLSKVIETVERFATYFPNVIAHFHVMVEPYTKISYRCYGVNDSITDCDTIHTNLSQLFARTDDHKFGFVVVDEKSV